MYNIKAVKYPNNEIRVARGQSKPLRDRRECDSDGCVDEDLLDPVEREFIFSSPDIIRPLSLVPNSQTERSGAGFGELPRRVSVFGLNAKRALIRRGAAMEEEAPPNECLFLTGTLPGSTEDSFKAIAQWASYIVHRLKSWIGNYVRSKLDFYCWEYQKRGALHLHYCVWVPNEHDRGRIVDEFHGWWVQILHRIGGFCNTDMFRKNSTKTHIGDTSKVRAIAEVCRKSPARYLAKYLSKSANPARGSARAFSPARWWGTSRPLKSLCDRLTETVEIIEGGFHSVARMWERVREKVDSSESVTYGYVHKFGMGNTSVSYPKSQEDSDDLWTNLQAISMRKMNISMSPSDTPKSALLIERNRALEWCAACLTSLSPSHQGLRTALEEYSNMMRRLTPSTSPDSLLQLLMWSARTSDIRYVSRFTPAGSRESIKMLDNMLDVLEWSIEEVAEKGWH